MLAKHFLLTRFNLPIFNTPQKKWAGRIQAKSKACCLDKKWLNSRLELFDTYCAPSVIGQSTKNFIWFILVHEDTPKSIVRYLSKYGYVVKGVGPDYKDASQAMWETIRETEREEFPWVISTGLDADDAISSNFMETIQNNFRSKREFINVVSGYVVAHSLGFQYIGGRKSDTVNHFRSFVEPRDNIFSVYGIYHGRSQDLAPIRHVKSSKATWLEVIHGDNCANRFKKNRNDKTRPLEEIAGAFSLDPANFPNPYEVNDKGYVRDIRWSIPKKERRNL